MVGLGRKYPANIGNIALEFPQFVLVNRPGQRYVEHVRQTSPKSLEHRLLDSPTVSSHRNIVTLEALVQLSSDDPKERGIIDGHFVD